MADEPKKQSVPPEDRRVALARKLTGGQRIPNSVSPPSMRSAPEAAPDSPRGAASSGSTPASQPSPPSSGSTPASQPRPSGRAAVLASRREALVGASAPGAPRPAESVPPEAPKTERKIGTGVLVLLALAALAGLVAVGFWAKGALYASSPEGSVRETLVSWELTPSSDRDAVFVQLDQLGPSALPYVIQFLGDGSLAERGGSHSSRPVREIAHLYLMRLAKNLKVAPPREADEIAKLLFAGTPPNDAQWTSSQPAWRAWVEAQQAKGTLAKP